MWFNRSVNGSAPPRIAMADLAAKLELTPSLFRVKSTLKHILYIHKPFTNSQHCSLSMHSSFASLSSSNFSLDAFLTPPYHPVSIPSILHIPLVDSSVNNFLPIRCICSKTLRSIQSLNFSLTSTPRLTSSFLHPPIHAGTRLLLAHFAVATTHHYPNTDTA